MTDEMMNLWRDSQPSTGGFFVSGNVDNSTIEKPQQRPKETARERAERMAREDPRCKPASNGRSFVIFGAQPPRPRSADEEA
ncbi:MAG: hypothetical protein HY852_16000 [Bradyrhizobium sp.]|uniref:hypothetical protein n=1 Tax=Bradyrhizobium sp. TaxID=376 RepID=UPI0025C18C66|nr:hypothetical protein [Bradyrhizobium sp.]MBI5263312.1 hypothetical protein [Bradyrhizobium sp.]